MIEFLIVQLSSSSTSFCHYKPGQVTEELISIDYLRSAILFSMKENLKLQVLYPDRALPDGYDNLLSDFSIIRIASWSSYYANNADVLVFDSATAFNQCGIKNNRICIYLLSAHNISDLNNIDTSQLAQITRLNIVLQGIENINSDEQNQYNESLRDLLPKLESLYVNQSLPPVNVLSDILFTNSMNNCDAGVKSISISPNGKFYLCPAFYYSDRDSHIGDPNSGICLKNRYLLDLEHAPICRICDAYQCKRCIWLNHLMTGELNTPSKEQCVLSHYERNQSKELLERLRSFDKSFIANKTIPEIDYLDPFDLISR